ncbi:MAG: thioredoxin-disulfide reductase [Candidatus Pacebacteria bacterium]|nr:thioredoxin-disulfide reductase [Candidatus Paceibacterota bacterium]
MAGVQNVIIIGSGPSGWSAAIYLARAQLQPLVFAGEKSGGQLMLTTVVENFPGFPQGIEGPQLMTNMREQAVKFGAIVKDTNVTRVDFSQKPLKVWAATGSQGAEEEYQAKAVLITTGAEAVWLDVPGEKEFIGRGVSTCAVCDAAFFKNKQTVVVGGGDAAMEDILALTTFASNVTVIHRRDSFRASKIMAERVLGHPKVKVIWNSAVQEIRGDGKVTGVLVENLVTHEKSALSTDGVFVAIGHRPSTELFKDHIQLDEKGFILTRFGLEEKSVHLAQSSLRNGFVQFPTMTSVEGVFAAGDVVDFRYKQAITAAGYGTMAALDIEWWLST